MALKLCEVGTGGDTKLIFAKGNSFLLKIKKKIFTNIPASAYKKKEHKLVQRICRLSADFSKTFFIRGGVEDTRLEAKAKDTKKIRDQGQGQPFRGQTLSWPRTGMLEAKAKDTAASVLKKKRSSKKFFRQLA